MQLRNLCPRCNVMLRFVVLCLCGVCAVGCGEQPTPQNAKSGPPRESVPVSGKVSASGLAELDIPSEGVEVDPLVQVSVTPWEEIFTAVKSAGKPTVLDVWSLSCEPCMREFPGLVALQSEHGEKIHCVSANIDFDGRKTHPPENYLSEVTRFLLVNAARLENHICSTPSDDVYAALDIDSIPAVLIFDAEGKEVARFVDAGETIGFTYEKDIFPFVQKMLETTE